MKTPKLHLLAYILSATLVSQLQAGVHARGDGAHVSSPTHFAPSSFHSVPRGSFGGGRFVGPGSRFSSGGMRAPSALRESRFTSFSRAYSAPSTRSATFNRGADRLRPAGNRVASSSTFNGRNHVVTRQGANWHRNWDRHHDHWWHGHRCHFGNGYWFIYDPWFYAYDYYPYGYPYGYSPDYYSSEYYSDVDGGADSNYSQGSGYTNSDPQGGSTISAVQAQLSKRGYYNGAIDGVYGSYTRAGVMRYQRDHGMRMSGNLDAATLRALGLQQLANN